MADLRLDDIREVTKYLERIPNGKQAAAMLHRFGLWTAEAHRTPGERKRFVSQLSQLTNDQVSDELGRWGDDYGRVAELVGILNGLLAYLKMQSKSARARARAVKRSEYEAAATEARTAGNPVPKPPTKTELDDSIEDDAVVREVDDQIALVELLLASASAAKEACQVYRETVSREIALRTAQMQARVF